MDIKLESAAHRGRSMQISGKKADELSRHKLRSGDILFARRGVQATGHIAYVREDEAGFLCGTGAIRLRVAKSNRTVSAEFLSHVFANPASIQWFKFHAIGATMPNLNEGIIRAFPLLLPSLDEQIAIAVLLSGLDDKIELNRRINETLEAIARAIFRDWFVDFGPTQAKIEGRPPYLASEIWSLFPDRLNEEGKPQGWTRYVVADVAKLTRGSVTPSSSPDETYEHYSLPAFDAGGHPALDFGSSIKSNKTPVPDNAILLSKLNPEIPRVWIPDGPSARQKVASTEFLSFQPTHLCDRALVYCMFTSPPFKATLEGMVTGTSKSHQRISPPALMTLEALSGEPKIFAQFEALAAPLVHQQLANRAGSRTLAQTRDLLLPRLMSGEIRVRDSEKRVEAAA